MFVLAGADFIETCVYSQHGYQKTNAGMITKSEIGFAKVR
jgi:hypothetical protein